MGRQRRPSRPLARLAGANRGAARGETPGGVPAALGEGDQAVDQRSGRISVASGRRGDKRTDGGLPFLFARSAAAGASRGDRERREADLDRQRVLHPERLSGGAPREGGEAGGGCPPSASGET